MRACVTMQEQGPNASVYQSSIIIDNQFRGGVSLLYRPVQPEVQLHVYAVPNVRQVPPLTHGSEKHSLMTSWVVETPRSDMSQVWPPWLAADSGNLSQSVMSVEPGCRVLTAPGHRKQDDLPWSGWK